MKYYIINITKNCVIKVCKDFQDLIMYCARDNYYSSWTKNRINNHLFDRLSLNYKDKYRVKSFKDYEVKYEIRDIMVIDEDNRIIDIRQYKDKIANCKEDYYFYKSKTNLIFRKSPIPYTKKRRCKIYRNPKTFQEIRENCDNETSQYIRAKRTRKYLPTYYDDINRGNYKSKSWKKQKIKKQYMKNNKKHIDTIKKRD